MIWIFLIIVIFILIFLASSDQSNKKNKNTLTREAIVFNLKDYPGEYDFSVSGVHLEPYIFPVLNYCIKYDVITLVLEPYNQYDCNAIKVESSGWHIGYVPEYETHEIYEIIKKDHISYIDNISKDGYITVTVKIRFK
ncbi:HIRAN domain-containing protein [Flavobacterium sp. W1B]|uniref:HIRAN domain-containing protein n=1 Tax=Flavobacterium sp. W1B TaxID=3394146 RepID=UPI0039BC8A17